MNESYERMVHEAMSQYKGHALHGLNACQYSFADSMMGLSQYSIQQYVSPYTGWYDKDNERYRKGQPTVIRRYYDWKLIARLNPEFLGKDDR